MKSEMGDAGHLEVEHAALMVPLHRVRVHRVEDRVGKLLVADQLHSLRPVVVTSRAARYSYLGSFSLS